MTAEEYAAYTNNVHITIGEEDDEKTFEEYIEDAFKAGMQEMREQMLKDAIEREVHENAVGFPYIDATGLYDYDNDKPLAKAGDKVRIIFIKEG